MLLFGCCLTLFTGSSQVIGWEDWVFAPVLCLVGLMVSEMTNNVLNRTLDPTISDSFIAVKCVVYWYRHQSEHGNQSGARHSDTELTQTGIEQRHRVSCEYVLGTLTPKHVHLLSAVFFHFHLQERWGMVVQTRHDILITVEDRG